MFVSVLELFKIGVGPSSSHTMGPMLAAVDFLQRSVDLLAQDKVSEPVKIRCVLKGSLAFTGKGHATDRAVALGLHGHLPKGLAHEDVNALIEDIWQSNSLSTSVGRIQFSPSEDIVFDLGKALAEHPNGMIMTLMAGEDTVLLSETYFSIGGGFIKTIDEIADSVAPVNVTESDHLPYPFDSANKLLQLAKESGLTIAEMKRANELQFMSSQALDQGLDDLIDAMCCCIETGLKTEGILPGGLNVRRRARKLHEQLQNDKNNTTLNDWLSVYAMAVNEENAAGHMVVTAPTNGAAGVIPAVLYYYLHHDQGNRAKLRDYLLTAAAIGGIIKQKSSISGAEVGCQGEVGSAAAMASAGLCAVKGGTPKQIENAAEIALEHHLGMTCDPVKGLVQVPCIERNAFGSVKAYTATSLSLRGDGEHFMPLDNCIEAMRQTGMEMSHKYKETSLGGLAVSIIAC